MAEIKKILAQVVSVATTLINVYTVGENTQAVVSTILICNRGNTTTTFRVSVAKAGALDSNSQYIYYNISISAADTFAATLGITLGENDVVRVYGGNSNLSINLFGVEIT